MSETETIARNLSGELARHRKTQAALAKGTRHERENRQRTSGRQGVV